MLFNERNHRAGPPVPTYLNFLIPFVGLPAADCSYRQAVSGGLVIDGEHLMLHGDAHHEKFCLGFRQDFRRVSRYDRCILSRVIPGMT